jgi:hypothetical protein
LLDEQTDRSQMFCSLPFGNTLVLFVLACLVYSPLLAFF